jgi:hypothetical protein
MSSPWQLACRLRSLHVLGLALVSALTLTSAGCAAMGLPERRRRGDGFPGDRGPSPARRSPRNAPPRVRRGRPVGSPGAPG